MVPLLRFHLPFTDVLLLHTFPQHGFFSSITLPKPSLYIHLGSCATNTAWSVCYIVTYLNDDTACTVHYKLHSGPSGGLIQVYLRPWYIYIYPTYTHLSHLCPSKTAAELGETPALFLDSVTQERPSLRQCTQDRSRACATLLSRRRHMNFNHASNV